MDIAADTDALFVRAHNAIMDAKRLVGINLDWQARILAEMDQMFLRAYFPPRIGKSSIRRKYTSSERRIRHFHLGDEDQLGQRRWLITNRTRHE